MGQPLMHGIGPDGAAVPLACDEDGKLLVSGAAGGGGSTDGLTNAQLRASPVPVSPSLPSGAATAELQDAQGTVLSAILAKIVASPATEARQVTTNAGIGAPEDAEAARGTNGSIVAILKGLFQGIGAANDNAALAGGQGSLSAKLRTLTALIGAKAGSASLSVVPATDAVSNVVGFNANPSANFSRPADTTAYAVGDLVANNTTAGSVAAMQLAVARVAAGGFMLRRCKLAKSGTTVTNAAFRVHFFTSAPTFTNGDNGVLSTNGVANYLGAMDVTMDRTFTDGACGFGTPIVGSDITAKLASGTNIFAVIEARGAYTPISGETFTLTLDDIQN